MSEEQSEAQIERLVRATIDLRTKHLNLSQKEFADRLGVGLATVQACESVERRGPKMDMWRKLAEFATESGAPQLARPFVEAFRAHWGPVMTETIAPPPADPDDVTTYLTAVRNGLKVATGRELELLLRTLDGIVELYHPTAKGSSKRTRR